MDFSTLSFTQSSSFLAFSQTNETRLEQSSLGALFTASDLTNNDPNATVQFPSSSPLMGEEYPYVVLTAMVPSSNSQETYLGELFAGAGEQIAPEAGKSTSLEFQSDGRYHGQVVSFYGQPYWEGAIHFLRLDYFNSAQEGDQFTLYSLHLAKTLEEAQPSPRKKRMRPTHCFLWKGFRKAAAPVNSFLPKALTTMHWYGCGL